MQITLTKEPVSYTHLDVYKRQLVNIPGKKKSLTKRFVETSAFCEILDCSVGCPVVQGQVKRCGRCCAGFALSLTAFAG